MSAHRNAIAIAVAALAACSKPSEGVVSNALFDAFAIDTPPGMSGLAVDERGVMWGIPERDRILVEITLGDHAATTTRHPIDGVPAGVDTEALAWLGGGKLAIGTEGATAATASVLYAELRGDRVVVTRERPVTSGELGVELTINHGIEGACGHGDDVLVGVEAVGKLADGTRWAPIARLAGDALTVTKLHLTSAVGKISSLDCTIASDGTAQVWAIERHYGVSRILRFALPRGAAEVTPTIALDLEPVLHGALNLEGIVQLPDGRLAAINDNQGRTVEGPTELLVFHPR